MLPFWTSKNFNIREKEYCSQLELVDLYNIKMLTLDCTQARVSHNALYNHSILYYPGNDITTLISSKSRERLAISNYYFQRL